MTSNYSYTNYNDSFSIYTGLESKMQMMTLTYTDYDYVLTFDGQFSDFLNTKTWQNDNNSYIVDININTDFFSVGYNNILINSDNNNILDRGFSGLETNIDFDTRVLEILAIKIFGNGKARAAISNDINIIAPIKNNLSNHFQNVINVHKNDIFNEYVNTKNIDLNTNQVTNFDFSNDVLSFPAFISGVLTSSIISDGPNVGGNLMINGSYNVPILIKIGNTI